MEEIQKHKQKLYLEDSLKIKAIHELSFLLRELALSKAARLSGFVSILRSLKSPMISENLEKYLMSHSNFRLRHDIRKLIVKCESNEYVSFEMYKHWNRVRRGLFWFYYYENEDFINVYTIPEIDLPRYVNHNFSVEDKEVYMGRLRGEVPMSISLEKEGT